MELKEVFEPVLNFIRNLQKKDKELASKQAAKDRLKLVLMQDRASVSPDFFELMKKEIIDVIKKYIEIDEESLEVQLTRGLEAGLEGPALYANIPIKNVKPVAPSNDDSEDIIMTEENAEKVAEKILNQIEEAANVQKEEVVEDKNIEEIKENLKDISENNDVKETVEEVKEEKKVKKVAAKKTTAKSSTKSASKTTATKKTTTTRAKKETKK